MTRFLAVLSGLLLATAVGIVLPWAAIPVFVTVVAGWWFRSVAVVAVLIALGALAWADTGALAAAGTGLVATTYLLNTATLHAPAGVVPTTLPSVIGALGFAAAAVLATLIPGRLAWLPLAAPVLVIVLYAAIVQGLTVREDAPDSAEPT
ncbi:MULTISPECIES: hypothetical protein [Nocardia]|jgi:hypothetical protein|uniref:Uncharacterized protein n=1 Tax=Nocardia nova TaxID=37330 RepID=A0A2S6A4M2_9NOCA|nr:MULTISPECIES: hypothetical protein [Nocardia]OBF67919.1 hypothetical protein A9X06_35675 [Mycobacterium sp. 852002-51759_SCH5129042]MBF6272003.1 hypothetical protein [Nocardia nova]MBV7702184.1 hypothetical protein [Nocardia nova]OBA42320.1 hypothetical protein A5789_12950 [Nocardia sp. 852002-51101_SCH5132738]OBB34270.1 hypothetical protein A5748_06965 [Nocardia sp. 852002-51244_SCH5132740]